MKLVGDGQFGFQVVGESHHQAALQQIAGAPTVHGHHLSCDALLRLEPNNPYDTHAVAVIIDGQAVGYIPAHMAGELFELLRQHDLQQIACPARIVGGWDRHDGNTGLYGVRLDLVRPFRLATLHLPTADWDGPPPGLGARPSLLFRIAQVVMAGLILLAIVAYGLINLS